MSRGNVQDILPLSPLQEGILFHALCHPRSGVYVTQLGWTLRGELDGTALRHAFATVVDRHETMRTGFVWEPRQLQVVLRRVELPWAEEDWRGLAAAEQQQRQQGWLAADRERGFDLSRPPLARLVLLRLEEKTCRLIWTFHHLALDGWSTTIVLREAFALYAAVQRGERLELPPPRSYRDYLSWLRGVTGAAAESFWRQMLGGVTQPTSLGIERPAGTAAPAGPHVKWQWRLAEPAAAALHLLARRLQLTPSTLLHGAWALLLGRASGRDDVVFGTLLSGRPADLAGSEAMVGLFINTLPVRVELPSEMELPAWLQQLQLTLAKVREHGHCRLVDVHGWSGVPRRLPLFESVLIFDNVGLGSRFGVTAPPVSGLAIENAFGIDQNSLPLTLTVRPDLLDFEYDPRQLSAAAVAGLGEELGALLELIVAQPQARLGEIQRRLAEVTAERRAARGTRRARSSFERFKQGRPSAVALPRGSEPSAGDAGSVPHREAS